MPTYAKHKATFSNFVELETELNSLMRQAEENTLKIMLDKLEDFISQDVYERSATLRGYTQTIEDEEKSSNYKRTFNLYDIWEIKKPYISHGKVYGSIAPTRYKAMIYNDMISPPQHMSPKGYRGHNYLTTEEYVHIINDGLTSSHSMFGTILPRPFWTHFNEWAGNNYKSIYEEELQKLL